MVLSMSEYTNCNPYLNRNSIQKKALTFYTHCKTGDCTSFNEDNTVKKVCSRCYSSKRKTKEF